MNPIRIVIADDHPIVLRGLRHIVESEHDLTVVGEMATADEIRGATFDDCDVLVLDLAIPGAVGLSVLKELRLRYPAWPILILSSAPEEQFAARALRDGASGYLTKRSAPEHLVTAVRCVADGRLYVSAAIAATLAADSLAPARSQTRPHRLSDREIEVVRLLASGVSLTAIAKQLEISIKTVSTHRQRALAKLGLDSNAALVRYAVHERLVDS